MTIQEAILARHSVRQYLNKDIEEEKVAELQQAIGKANTEAGTDTGGKARIHLQLVTKEPLAFSQGLAKYGKFSGVSNYIVLVCRRGNDELVGYYGERVALLAQMLGLNSCWVGLTYKKQPDHYTVEADEAILGVIALGYGVTQGVQHSMRPLENYCKVQGAMPEWFRKGMEAAMLAPTATHMQKFEFELLPDGKVAARTRFALIGSYREVDLGIVKYHFEIGAGTENFVWA